MAAALDDAESGRERLYHIHGGDFIVLLGNTQESELARFAQILETTFRANSALLPFATAYGVDWTICNGSTGKELEEAYHDAHAAARTS